MVITIDNKNVDFKKIIKMGQFFMYFELDKNTFLVQSSNKICKIIINKLTSNIISDNIDYWINYFDLNNDYTQINKYLKDTAIKNNDALSLKCIEKGRGLRLCNQPYLETCIEYLLSAQSNIFKIRKNMLNILTFGSKQFDSSIGIEYNAFPTIEELQLMSETDFVNCGAGFRAKYIVEFVNNYNVIDSDLSYEEILKILMEYKGIGPKIANCIALYGLNKRDAFPIDVWIQRYLDLYPKEKSFEIPDKYAGILQVYIYQYIRDNRGEKL